MITLTSIVLGASLISAAPLHPRAGGPIATPIPPNCTVSNPLPHTSCGPVNGYRTTLNFSSNLVFQAYYQSPLSTTDTWIQCEEQCYGFGTPGTCKFVLLAYDVPTPDGWQGSSGGDISPTACLMYSKFATPDDFELGPEGEYLEETAANISC